MQNCTSLQMSHNQTAESLGKKMHLESVSAKKKHKEKEEGQRWKNCQLATNNDEKGSLGGRERKWGEEERSGNIIKTRGTSKLWVPLVILTGSIIGILTYLVFPPTIVVMGPRFPEESVLVRELLTELAIQLILTNISIFLLISLLVVYARTYAVTKANFILGLIIVLFAFLLESLLTYPLIYSFVNGTPLESRSLSSPIADIFTVIAYSIFLYLSLE